MVEAEMESKPPALPNLAVFREALSSLFAQIRSFELVFGLELTDDLAGM
jgi:hypothetical protein